MNVLARATFCIVALFALSEVAQAQTIYFPGDTTLDYAVNGRAIIGYANFRDFNIGLHGSSPTVSLVNGGSISNYLYTFNESRFNVAGGAIFGDLTASDSSFVNVSNGNLYGSVIGQGASTVTISGGNIRDHVYTSNNSTINITGGNLNGILVTKGSGTLNLFGRGLSALLTYPDFFGYDLYSLSGTLQDGTPLAGKTIYAFQDHYNSGAHARFNLYNSAVPEPGRLAFFVGSAAVLGVWHKRRNQLT